MQRGTEAKRHGADRHKDERQKSKLTEEMRWRGAERQGGSVAKG